jgi:NAD(P)-dependent dehydrogenase (short-subunit alcohol dehydrogenase family)
VARLFARAADELGPLTGLVNNAGVTSPLGPLADQPAEELRKVVDVNLVGYLLCAKHAIRAMSGRAMLSDEASYTTGAVLRVAGGR